MLAFASKELPKDKYPPGYKFELEEEEKRNFPMDDFTLIGFVSLIDPPRESVKVAI